MIKSISLCCVLISLNAETVSAAPLVSIDQQNTVVNPRTVIGVGTLTFGQSFTPSFSSIDAVEIAFTTGTGTSTWKIEILDGNGLDGDILGSSSPVTFSRLNVNSGPPVHFDLLSRLSVIPGQEYTARMSNVSGSTTTVGIPNPPTEDFYLGGSAFFPFPSTVTDILFSVGLHTAVPEPSTLFIGVVLTLGFLSGRLRRLGSVDIYFQVTISDAKQTNPK